MKTNSPRRDAKIRIALYFVLTAASFILFTRAELQRWGTGLFLAASFALFAGPRTLSRPERNPSKRAFWFIFIASYFAIMGYYLFSYDAPMPPYIAAVLCVMTLVFCALQWREAQNADEEQLRKSFEEEKWPGG